MKSDFFIDRPIFSIVISIVIVIVGVLGLFLLPIDQYPQIVPPVVKVSASYPGASAQTVTQAVATPIEQELNGTPGMLYMESTNSNSGSFSATITFDISTDPDLAAVEIQNRVKQAEARLPAEVVQNGISVEKQASSRLMTVTLRSNDPKFDEIYLSNYATLNVLDMLRRVKGVGSVSNVGSRYYAMQIWVQPDRLANLGLTVDDLQKALKDQNRESAAGVLGQQPISDIDITTPIIAQGRLSSVGEFEDIVIRANPDGSLIRLRDVARISLEAQSYNTESGINGGNAAVLNINMLPGANAMEVAESVKKEMEEISRNFPEGITYEIPFDMTSYISQSINEVYHTLFEALILVILVVFLSLQNWRATLIPVIAVPISLIGTFGIMLAFGFSLNMMTLLGLILAIGIVVDDAIVVVENVERIMNEEHLSPYEATKKAMQGLGSAIIATSLVLCAVFVPVSFLVGITGQLYRQFTITIAVSVLISTLVALTLSPAMCALLLKPDSGKKKNKLFRYINLWLARGNRLYEKLIRKGLKHARRVVAAFGISLIAIWVLNEIVPQSFMPQEDQGYFTVELELPEGATLERTRHVTERAMNYLMSREDVEYVLNVTGSSPRVGTNQSRSQLTVILKPWEDRKSSNLRDIMEDIREELKKYPESKVYLSTPPVIPGLGSSGGFEMVLEARSDASYADLQRAADTLLYYASQRKEISGLSSSIQNDIPQLYFDVDRDKAQMLGVKIADIFSTLKTFTGSIYVNDFNMFNRIYRVYIQAEAPYRAHKDNLGLFFVKGSNNAMIPITALGTTSYTTGPGTIRRFNMFTSTTISGEAAPGYSSGQAMAILEEIASKHLPKNIGVEWSGLSYQEKHVSG
ncbi:efflux RND transporter permease subunit, partial [Barnesiella intestinihominis]